MTIELTEYVAYRKANVHFQPYSTIGQTVTTIKDTDPILWTIIGPASCLGQIGLSRSCTYSNIPIEYHYNGIGPIFCAYEGFSNQIYTENKNDLLKFIKPKWSL